MKQAASRRTQEERSSATRRALVDAAIECIFQHGYAATTTITITNRAGVSRGGMLHQFPTKADLMATVVQEVHDESVLIYAHLLAGIDGHRDRLIAYADAVWAVESRPAGVAVLEILLASRSDTQLREKIAPIIEQNEKSAMRALLEEFHQPPSPALLHLILACVRGLTVTRMLAPDQDGAQTIALLQRMLRASWEAGALRDPVLPYPHDDQQSESSRWSVRNIWPFKSASDT